jgi:drug/metabolite transporter (DMT)-like permease
MNFSQVILAIICVLAISCGQILFKWIGLEIQQTGNWFNWKVLFSVGMAFTIYSSATALWIFLLKNVELSKIYVFMALSFILVPVASNIFFDEKLSAFFLLGIALIISGILVILKYG